MPSKRVVRPVTARPREEPEEAEANGDEERPATTRSKSPLHEGWTEGEKQIDSTSTYAQAYKPGEKLDVIKFLEDKPYVSIRRHWVDVVIDNEKKRRPYTCLKTYAKECPLCEIGVDVQAVACFNIVIVGDDGQLILRSWDVGARLFKTLKSYSNDPKVAPLSRGFFLVNKTGKGGSSNTTANPVSARTVEEDYDIPIPSASELDAVEKYTKNIITVPTVKQLEEVAAELADDYD